MSANYNQGDQVRIFSLFILTEKSRLTNISVRAPHPKVEASVEDVLNKIIIQEELTKKLPGKSKDGKFSIPIFYVVRSKSKMKRIMTNRNRRKKNRSQLVRAGYISNILGISKI